MGNTFFFLVDFIIAQNLEKVKFWNLLSEAKQGQGGKEGRGGRCEEAREGRETGKMEKGVMEVKEEGWRSGVSSFYHLPGRPPRV